MHPTPAAGQPRQPVPELLDAALAAAARGWHVFPLRPGDKRPAVRDWQTRATADPARIRRCWTTGPYNVGIACGPSRLVVVDLDTPKPGDSPPGRWALPGVLFGEDVLAVLAEEAGQPFPFLTYNVRTGRAGLHLSTSTRRPAPSCGTPPARGTGSAGWWTPARPVGTSSPPAAP
jgi:hypothetical protein